MNLFDFLVKQEEPVKTIYLDHKWIPSIGVGYNLQSPDVLKVVVEHFGYTRESIGSNNYERLVEELSDNFNSGWTPGNKSTKTAEVNAILVKYKGTLTEPRSTFEFKAITNPELGKTDLDAKYDMRHVFDTVVADFDKKIITQLDLKLTNKNFEEAKAIYESLSSGKLSPIRSMAFNGGPGILGSDIAKAIAAKNVADVFWEIKFRTNSNSAKQLVAGSSVPQTVTKVRIYGLQNRRDAEAALLLQEMSIVDKKNLYDKLAANEAFIEQYYDEVKSVSSANIISELSKEHEGCCTQKMDEKLYVTSKLFSI